MNFVFDSHAHYFDRRFEQEYEGGADALLNSIYPTQVSRIVNVGTDCGSSRRAIAQAANYEGMYVAAGVHPGDCHYVTGNYYTRRRMALLFNFLDYMGIERERTRVEWVSAAEGARFSAVMNDFVETVTKLGENKRLTDLRVKEGE